ncbi:MAG: hypothetical protein JSU83_17240 [Deltaproteobacteria bacterium]|nr:MAG: hypothetical protein JSU83_17240 [Deltaproteobacteria bacterium]
MNKDKIAKTVREVLKEQGLAIGSSQKRLSTQGEKTSQGDKSQNGPAVLNVFHAGVRKLEEALKQVQLIEETTRRSSVYTVESARTWVCGADVKEKAGVRCILDTVKSDGLERILQKADILVLPTFCLKTAAKIANLICDDQESGIVFRALLQGKKVLAASDGFLICDILTNQQLRNEIDQILKKLEGFGMVFCQTEQLNATFQKMIMGDEKSESPVPSNQPPTPEEHHPTAVKLITAKTINLAVDSKQNSIRLAPGGKVTPLARDLAKEYSIEIIKSNIF